VHVFIVDPHPIFRRGLAASVSMMDGVGDVGQAEGVRDAWDDPELGCANVVVLDCAAAGGAEFIADVREATGAKVIVCTADGSDEAVLTAVRAGARGYLLKDSLTHDGLQSALAAVAGGASVVPPDVLDSMVAAASPHADTEHEGHAPAVVRLSERERSVLALIAEGLPTREVAVRLSYSERTIKNVLHDVVTKLNARSRSQAVAQAVRDGLI
jgi:DNA-binding NarL/FixJ family response regulator